MKKFFTCLVTIILFAGCNDHDDDYAEYEPGGEVELPSPKPNDAVDPRLFEVVNLDWPGLENVKKYYEEDKHYLAAQALLEYFRLRTNVENPNLSLVNVTSTATDKNKADYAKQYRLFVNNYYEDAAAEKPYLHKKDGAIDWTYNPAGADEYLKQLHRLQWAVPQAKVYRTTGDETYIKSWMEIYSDWIAQNPIPAVNPADSTPWWQLQAAARLTDMAALFEYYKNSENFTPEWLSVFLVSLAEHADYLNQNHYGVSGNILVSQATALAYAGVLFPEFKNADVWMNDGYGILSAQVGAQFLADGMHIEMDLSYHIAAIADFYEAMRLAEANRLTHKLPANFNDLLYKAVELVKNVTYPKYFNKGTTNYCIPGFNDTRPASWTNNVLNNNFKKYTHMFPEDDEMLYMSSKGTLGIQPGTDMKTFAESGYYVMRNGWSAGATMLIMSNNTSPNDGAIASWTHNQPDNGTFELYHNGRNFFPDSGAYAYYNNSGGNSDRNAFRRTKMHNTITLDDANLTTANGKLLGSYTSGGTEIIAVENQSYSNLKHRRYVFFVEKSFFVIVDEAIGTAAGTVNLNFNLCEIKDSAADVVFDASQMGAYTAFADNNNIKVCTFGDAPLSYAEKNDGKVSYVLNSYIDRLRYSVDCVKGAEDEAVRFITVIYPVNGAANGVVIHAGFDEGYTGSGVKTSVTVNGVSHNLECNL